MKNNKGITLVTLVITIFVLVVLSTVSINAVLSENGILKKSQQTQKSTENNLKQEEEKLDEAMEEYNKKMKIQAGWDSDKVVAVKSEDNEYVPVPIGYTASTVSGEKKVNTGFVIKEGSDGGATSGINEFVWVPVRDITEFYDATNKSGQLWDFSGTTSTRRAYPTTNSGNREPDVVTSASSSLNSASGSDYDAVSTNLQQAGLSSTATANDLKGQLQVEFNSMIDSIKTYGGFYIGRYETGNLSSTTKAVVKKGNTDISSQSWYKMYKVSKTIAANSNVTTSMLWGCQWDATMRWMQQEGTTDKVKNFPTDTTSTYGNYSNNSISYVTTSGTTTTTTAGTNTRIPTGNAEITNINNIYNMAGNVHEWTIEASSASYRALRGGSYTSNGSSYPARYRGNGYPTTISANYGTRASLYIKK